MATTNASVSPTANEFVTVPGDRHSEVAHTLAEPVPLALAGLPGAQTGAPAMVLLRAVAALITLLVGRLAGLTAGSSAPGPARPGG